VHLLADQIRILDEGRLVAVHPVLDGRRQSRVDPSHRHRPGSRALHRTADDVVIVGRLGDHVAQRSRGFYQAVGDQLAIGGGRS
jgi:hypothetical protein